MAGTKSNVRRSPERPVRSRAPAERNSPSASQPVRIAPAPEGLSFADLLHDCLDTGVIFIDGKKKVKSLNGQARHLLGLSPDQANLPSLAALPAALQTMVRQALSSGKSIPQRQVQLKAGDHGPVVLQASAIPAQAGRKNSGVVLVLNDLTPVRLIEHHIQQLDRLASVGTLAAGIAHEIKNALVAGKTFVDLLLEKHQDAELVEVVRREMSRIDDLVSRMRRFAGSDRPVFREVRLHEVLEHSLRLIQPQLENKLVSVNRSFLASPDVLHGDDYQLQQAFMNLFLNALEAMGPNGILSVATNLLPFGAASDGLADGPDQPRLQLTIRDNGIGIASEHMARLFQPFFTTKPHGTGLGLLLTRRIIQEHRGTITVESEPDKGTSFQIILPTSA
jgi:two-component system, NtrC family, nitrogen regulation sensor histidine kinase GlnL